MSITDKLGKIGIPGFRTGKKWKMVIAICGYSLLFLWLFTLNPGQQDSNNAVIPTPTPTPEPTQSPNTTIEEAKQYIVDALERDPVIVDAGVSVEGTQGSIAVYIVNPEEADRVYTLSKTMANVFLREQNIKSVIIGVYKGDDQLKYGAEWL